ncbi:hypothetical protein, partial [Aeromonas salmonicida]|uniref:hypothetical protein n=1 Tax=Aeromonas salmonicida TaxID=645 RepID=UPI0031CFADAA
RGMVVLRSLGFQLVPFKLHRFRKQRRFIRYSGKEWNSTSKGSASRAGCRSSSTTSAPSCW